jgi:hypothetical protein
VSISAAGSTPTTRQLPASVAASTLVPQPRSSIAPHPFAKSLQKSKSSAKPFSMSENQKIVGMISPDHFINLPISTGWHHRACTPRQVLTVDRLPPLF